MGSLLPGRIRYPSQKENQAGRAGPDEKHKGMIGGEGHRFRGAAQRCCTGGNCRPGRGFGSRLVNSDEGPVKDLPNGKGLSSLSRHLVSIWNFGSVSTTSRLRILFSKGGRLRIFNKGARSLSER